MNKICYGCGAKLQSDHAEELGYVPIKKREDAVYCMRCFRLMHYGEEQNRKAPKQNKVIIKRVNAEPRFSIFLVDFMNINQEIIALFKAIKAPKVLVVNKCELLPKHIKREKIRDYIATYYGVRDKILLKGGTKRHGIESIFRFLEKEKIIDAYILGMSNAGKSTFINDLMDYCGSSASKIVASKKANTTVDFIRVPLTKDLMLIDTPGFILDHALKVDTTGKAIKAITLQMKEGETASLLANQYFLKFEDNTPITFYTNESMKKPIHKYFKAAPHLVQKVKLLEDDMDIVLKGIGFVSVKKKTVITTNVDLECMEIRKSMFGGDHE